MKKKEIKILLVDDEPDILEIVGYNLTAEGYQVITAENGIEAVTCGHTHYPEDLVLDGIRYVNTGAWTEFPAHYLHITAENMVLNQMDPSFVSHHAESSPLNQDDAPIPFTDAAPQTAEASQVYRGFAP